MSSGVVVDVVLPALELLRLTNHTSVVQETADDQSNVYDPGCRADQDTQCIGHASYAWKQSENNRHAQDPLLVLVLDVALIVDIFEQCPDDGREKEGQWWWPKNGLRYK